MVCEEDTVPEILFMPLTVHIVHDEVRAMGSEVGILRCCCSPCSKTKHPTNHPSVLVIPIVITVKSHEHKDEKNNDVINITKSVCRCRGRYQSSC